MILDLRIDDILFDGMPPFRVTEIINSRHEFENGWNAVLGRIDPPWRYEWWSKCYPLPIHPSAYDTVAFQERLKDLTFADFWEGSLQVLPVHVCLFTVPISALPKTIPVELIADRYWGTLEKND